MVLAIAYLFMLYSLGNSASTVNRLGTYLVAQHQRPYKRAYKEAVKALEHGNTSVAMSTLTAWQNIKKGDRVFSHKRELLNQLTGELHNQNRVPEFLDWANKWRALDDRDITARAYYFEALRLSPEFHSQGLDGLSLAYKHFPKNQRLAELHANTLREAGGFIAADKMQENKVTEQSLDWELFWDTGEGFNATEKSKIKIETTLTDNSRRINFALPANTRKFRLDLPPSSTLTLSSLAIQINGLPYLINPDTIRLVMMQYAQGLFSSAGDPDPFIIFDLKNMELSKGEVLNLEITFTISLTRQQHRVKQS